MTVPEAVKQAYKSGAHMGDTGLFDKWLCDRGLQDRGNALVKRLRQEFERGVIEGEQPGDKAPKPSAVAIHRVAPQSPATRHQQRTYKGYRTRKTEEGAWVSSLDWDSEFDTEAQLHRFIDEWRSEHRKGRANPALKVYIIPQSIGGQYYAEWKDPGGQWQKSHNFSSPQYAQAWVEQYVYKAAYGPYEVVPRLQWKPDRNHWGHYSAVVKIPAKSRGASNPPRTLRGHLRETVDHYDDISHPIYKYTVGLPSTIGRAVLGSKNPYTDGMDEIDVRRVADKRVVELARSTGMESRTARKIALENVREQYNIAVQFGQVPAGMWSAWLAGWRGTKMRNPEPEVESMPSVDTVPSEVPIFAAGPEGLPGAVPIMQYTTLTEALAYAQAIKGMHPDVCVLSCRGGGLEVHGVCLDVEAVRAADEAEASMELGEAELEAENPQQWVWPKRSGKKNLERVSGDWGILHDIGFSGTHTWRAVKITPENNALLKGYTQHSRREALADMRKLMAEEGGQQQNPAQPLHNNVTLELSKTPPNTLGNMAGPYQKIMPGTPLKILQRGRGGHRILVEADYFGTPLWGWVEKAYTSRGAYDAARPSSEKWHDWEIFEHKGNPAHGTKAKLYILWGGQYDVRDYTWDQDEHEWYGAGGNRVLKVNKKQDPVLALTAMAERKLKDLRTEGYLEVDGRIVTRVEETSNPIRRQRYQPPDADFESWSEEQQEAYIRQRQAEKASRPQTYDERRVVERRGNPAIGTKDPRTMTAGQVNAEIAKLDKLSSQVTDAFIAAGRGDERPSDFLQMPGDPLVERYRAVHDRRSQLVREVQRQMGPGHYRFPHGWRKSTAPWMRNPARQPKYAYILSDPNSPQDGTFKLLYADQAAQANREAQEEGIARRWVRQPATGRNPSDAGTESFALQFFNAGRGYGTTIQSARARIKKWRAEGTHERDLQFYENAVSRYEQLKRDGMTKAEARRAHDSVYQAMYPRRNPLLLPSGTPDTEAAADNLYEDFHGRPPEEHVEVVTEVNEPTHLATLGAMVTLKLETVTGKEVTIGFEEDPPDLCSTPDGTQLYFQGGNQHVDLSAFGMSGEDWERYNMVLGDLTETTYRTQKKFDKFKTIDYYHANGEESGIPPQLLYDPINKLLSVAGGRYKVLPEGIVD